MPSRILTVSSLNNYIKNIFDDELMLHDISLIGEIFEFKLVAGKTFITLKEDNALVSCLRFAVTEKFEVGAMVTLFGSISFSPKNGKITFIFKSIKLSGEGNYALQLKNLKTKLELEGLFVNAQSLPSLIKKVAVLTSAEGAVVHDIVSVMKDKKFMPDLDIFGVRVQGEDAPAVIANTLKSLNTKLYDVVVIARGGGAADDLKAFNTETVARAVHGAGLPVISAVGHETDYTLCDFCSTVRAGTPSIAAQIIVDVNEKAFNDILWYNEAIEKNINRVFNTSKVTTSFHIQKCLNELEKSISKNYEKLAQSSDGIWYRLNNKVLSSTVSLKKSVINLATNMSLLLVNKENEFKNTVDILEKVNPLKLLKQGYARVERNENIIDSIKDVSCGDTLSVTLLDGKITAEVKERLLFKEN